MSGNNETIKMNTENSIDNKFIDPHVTAKGEARGYIDFVGFKNLWFNTGTLCNLTCDNCYIESSPKNDRLSYLTKEDVNPFLDEIKSNSLKSCSVDTIGFTGGEPFLNPNMIEILELVLKYGFRALVLTNGVNVISRVSEKLETLNKTYPNQLRLRISLDHYTKEVHEKERGENTFQKAIDSLKWLSEKNIHISIAGRSLLNENIELAQLGFQKLISDNGIDLKLTAENLVIFPEMDLNREVPEITTQCFDILNVKPEHQMCASERMVVKKKNNDKPTVMPCTLLAYDPQFELGETLKDSQKRVFLNHKFCAEFCILGGASCSST